MWLLKALGLALLVLSRALRSAKLNKKRRQMPWGLDLGGLALDFGQVFVNIASSSLQMDL
jgi:hypothetical protein